MQEMWSHTLQKTDTQQQCSNKDPIIITLFGKRGNFKAVEPPLFADMVYLREIFP